MTNTPKTLIDAVKYYADPKVTFEAMLRVKWPDGKIVCPKCGNKKLSKQVSRFAMSRKLSEPAAKSGGGDDEPMPDFDDPRIERAMMEMERDMEHLDENNPKHMAHMMKKMKDLMPAGTMPKELDVAIKRLEAGPLATVEDRNRFPVRIRYARAQREDEEVIKRLLINGSSMSAPAAVAGGFGGTLFFARALSHSCQTTRNGEAM
jgi:uncharacterized Zn finger protein (UPF0148 family)